MVWSGRYLRVYTDLGEYEENSPTALALCEKAASYLTERLRRKNPVVFVHAAESDNGHVVLANKLNAKDSCEVAPGTP